MRVECVNPLELSPGDIAVWRRLLLSQPALSSPYLTPDWAQAVARHRPDVRVAVYRDEDGRALAFLPVQRPNGFAAAPAGGPVCDYQALIAPPDSDFDPSQAAQALGVGRIDFTAGLKESALAPHLLTSDVGHIADFSQGWDAYAEDRRKAGTKIIQRGQKNLRRLVRDFPGGVDFEPFATDPLAFDMMISWKREQMWRTRVHDIFQHAWINDLVRDTFTTPATSAFGGALFVLRVERRPAAMIYCLQARAALHAWQIVYDHRFADYTPGIVLFVEMIRLSAEAGFTKMDLGPGDYRFKTSLANAERPCGAGFVGRPGLSSAVRAAQFQMRALVETLPVGRARQWPAKAMRRMDIHAGLAVARDRAA
jgi:CelD/BcsL family acetyltransferase involved in cellulose biosynthesis